MKMKEESEEAGLKFNIQKMKIMALGFITSCQIDGERMKTVIDCMFLDSRITVDGDCSHGIKRHLLLGRKAMTNLDSILRSKDIAYRGPYSQGYGFSSGHVWMWELDSAESWALKNWCFLFHPSPPWESYPWNKLHQGYRQLLILLYTGYVTCQPILSSFPTHFIKAIACCLLHIRRIR